MIESAEALFGRERLAGNILHFARVLRAAGLPIGLQLVGPPWAEDRLLAVAAAYENATAWHNRRPAEGSA